MSLLSSTASNSSLTCLPNLPWKRRSCHPFVSNQRRRATSVLRHLPSPLPSNLLPFSSSFALVHAFETAHTLLPRLPPQTSMVAPVQLAFLWKTHDSRCRQTLGFLPLCSRAKGTGHRPRLLALSPFPSGRGDTNLGAMRVLNVGHNPIRPSMFLDWGDDVASEERGGP